jgi:hypothetical protein
VVNKNNKKTPRTIIALVSFKTTISLFASLFFILFLFSVDPFLLKAGKKISEKKNVLVPLRIGKKIKIFF